MKRQIAIASSAVALAFVAGQVFSSTGDQPDAQAEPRRMAETLAGCIADEKFDDLKTEMWRCAVDEGAVASLSDQLSLPYRRLCEGLGARTKVEPLASETIGPSITRHTFAEFHTRGVIVWHFEFIKPKDEWKLHAYGFGPLRMDGASSPGVMPPLGG